MKESESSSNGTFSESSGCGMGLQYPFNKKKVKFIKPNDNDVNFDEKQDKIENLHIIR
jgi:hypothetical protein